MASLDFHKFNVSPWVKTQKGSILCDKIAHTRQKISFGASSFTLWNSRQRTTLFKKSNFSFLVGKRKSPATLEACQQPVSSTCMVVVARLITTALSQKLNISSNSHFPQFLPSHLNHLIQAWYLKCSSVSFKPRLSRAKLQALVVELRRSGHRLWGVRSGTPQKYDQVWVSSWDNQEWQTGLLGMKTKVPWKTLCGLSSVSVHTWVLEDS